MQHERRESRFAVGELPRLHRRDHVEGAAAEHESVPHAESEVEARIMPERAAIPPHRACGPDHTERLDLDATPVGRSAEPRSHQYGQSLDAIVRARRDEEEIGVRLAPLLSRPLHSGTPVTHAVFLGHEPIAVERVAQQFGLRPHLAPDAHTVVAREHATDDDHVLADPCAAPESHVGVDRHERARDRAADDHRAVEHRDVPGDLAPLCDVEWTGDPARPARVVDADGAPHRTRGAGALLRAH